MKRSKAPAAKKVGRPATGKDPLISARVPATLIEAIDRWARQSKMTRSQAVRRLLEWGLGAHRDKE